MYRVFAVAVALTGAPLPARAADPPEVGKVVEVEFTETQDKYGTGRVYEFTIPLQAQGDRYRIQLQPVGGVQLKSTIFVLESLGGGKFKPIGKSEGQVQHDYTMPAGVGADLRVKLVGYSLGKVNVRVTKVGAEPAGTKDGDLKDIKDEVAALRKELAELKQQLADVKKMLEKK